MLSFFFKFFLMATSLSPVLLILAISQLECGQPWKGGIWLGIAFIFLSGCWALLKFVKKNARSELISIQEFERKDQEVLTFLFIYLLPFIRSGGSTFANEPITSGCVLIIIIYALVQARAFHFNPVMYLFFRYRFYAVKDRHGVSNLLISKKDLRRSGVEIKTVALARNVYLHKGNSNV